MAHHKPFGIALGLLGNLAVALALNEMIGTGSCGGDLPACPDNLMGHIIMLPAGIIITMIAIFTGGGVFSFLGLFFAIGLGSLVAGFQSEDSGTQGFGYLFGGIFTAVATLVLVLGWRGWTGGRKRVAKAMDLVANGSRGIGTVKNVDDTGVTINDHPRVRITMRVEPEDGSPPFEVTKVVTVSRVDIPRRGDRHPVFYDDRDRSQWAYGTEMDPGKTPADIQALFEKASAPPLPEFEPEARPRPRPDDGPSDELAKLAELYAKGVLTAEEFEAAKARVLKIEQS